ncbi:MAG: type II toxin-antitoxin system RelE/ParE family toxin [Rhodanobacter sp.]|nr:MAG: type II toxin-antitoxin system RelE/ParE family toxin [Rhodanobacter sp.]
MSGTQQPVELVTKAEFDARMDAVGQAVQSLILGGGLFELRPRGREGIGRVFYCTQAGHWIVILHSFIKKMQETPPAELDTVLRRLKEIRRG